jgi:dolichol-phosphate mannosyltransferase
MDAITSFSYKPLRLSFLLTGLGMFAAAVAATASLVSRNVMNHSEYGIVASIFLTGSMLLFCIGILGEYIGRVYDEVRDRPLSIISEVYSPAQVSEQYLAAKEYAKDISSERVRIMPAA